MSPRARRSAARRDPEASGGRRAGERLVLDLDRHVPYFFTHISNRLSRGASRVYLKHFGLGITEWRVMGVLAVAPDLSANADQCDGLPADIASTAPPPDMDLVLPQAEALMRATLADTRLTRSSASA